MKTRRTILADARKALASQWGLLIAVLLAIALIFGCGGGGGEPIINPPPDDSITTEVRAEVRDARNRLVNGAIITGADQNSQTGTDGRFTVHISGKKGETKTLHLTHAAGVADIRVPLEETQLTLVDPVILTPRSREETFETTPAPQGVTVFPTIRVLNNGVVENWLPDEMEITNPAGVEVRTYTESGYNNGKKYLFATSQTETDVHFKFDNVPEGEGLYILLRTGRITFVTPTDSVKPAVTQVRVPDGSVSGQISVDGKVEDLYEDIYFSIDVTASRQQTIDLAPRTRDFNGHHIEGPPSGPDWLTVKVGNQELARTDQFAEDGSFEVMIDTTTLSNGTVELIFVAQDKTGNTSLPVKTTIQVDNPTGPTPLPESDMTKKLGFTSKTVTIPRKPYFFDLSRMSRVTADRLWITDIWAPWPKTGSGYDKPVEYEWVYVQGLRPDPNPNPPDETWELRIKDGEDGDRPPQIDELATLTAVINGKLTDCVVVLSDEGNDLRLYDAETGELLKRRGGVNGDQLQVDPNSGIWLVETNQLVRYKSDLSDDYTCPILGGYLGGYCVLPVQYETIFCLRMNNEIRQSYVVQINSRTGESVRQWSLGNKSPGDIMFVGEPSDQQPINQLVLVTGEWNYDGRDYIQTRSLTGELITEPTEYTGQFNWIVQEPMTGQLYGVEHVDESDVEAIVHELAFQ